MLYGDHHLETKGFTIKPAGRFENMLTGWDDKGFKATVHFPGLTREGWAFDEITDPWLLFSALDLYREKLGVYPTFWQRAAKDIFINSLQQRPVLCSEDPENYWRPFIDKMESEFIWTRQPAGPETDAAHAHAFDKRMMFLSAARGAMCGVGQYEEIGPTKYADLAGAVGLVEIERPKFNYPLRPEFAKLLADLFAGDSATLLVMTPYLPLFDKYESVPIKITRGWVWKKPKRLFETFAVKIGTAIKETRISDEPEAAEVNSALKVLYTRFFGWLGRLENRTGFAAELFRPDWRALIVAGAGVNLLRNIENVWEYTGKIPFAINHDCIMYFSEADHWPVDFDNKTAVADPNKFTHEWTAAGAAVREALAAGLNAGQVEKAVQNGE